MPGDAGGRGRSVSGSEVPALHVHFYRNVFFVVPKSKVKLVARMLKAIHEHEAFGGGRPRRFLCLLTSQLQRLQTNLRINVDTTAIWIICITNNQIIGIRYRNNCLRSNRVIPKNQNMHSIVSNLQRRLP